MQIKKGRKNIVSGTCMLSMQRNYHFIDFVYVSLRSCISFMNEKEMLKIVRIL